MMRGTMDTQPSRQAPGQTTRVEVGSGARGRGLAGWGFLTAIGQVLAPAPLPHLAPFPPHLPAHPPCTAKATCSHVCVLWDQVGLPGIRDPP